MIKNFRHACIVVKNLNKSLRFYKDILGLKLSKILTLKGKYLETVLNKKSIKLTYVKLRCPNQPKNISSLFELHYWHKPRISLRSGYNHISFTVRDLGQEYKRLTKMGVRFLSRPIKTPYANTKICFCYDPDNNLIEFIEDITRKTKK